MGLSLREMLVGAPRDPLDAETRHNIALVAFLAWVGLGADGLSSSCYGPEEAFLALGSHTHLGLYLAVATFLTVFIISIAYNQVIELFPSGGGGYKVASQLLGPQAGLVSGSALLVDYVLTIAISVASGVDAMFSLLPSAGQEYKLTCEVLLVGVLILLNLRGMRESIIILMPIFLGFFITHLGMIAGGIFARRDELPNLLPATFDETARMGQDLGWVGVTALFLRAYSLGGGTYTGLEAVSNNVNTLAEPRVRTGKLTMLFMALSLSCTAAGIIVLYLLWDVQRIPGQTLNAVTFNAIIDSWQLQSEFAKQAVLQILLALEGGLLFVAANTGFLGGPAVLANMAADSWVPRHFRELSSRLVTENGILLMGLGALAVLLWTHGSVAVLVVLYSINVFLTFSLALLGLCKHWWLNRRSERHWRGRMLLSALGLTVTAGVLVIVLVEKFTEGGWLTVVFTGLVIAFCYLINSHYRGVRDRLRKIDEQFSVTGPMEDVTHAPALQPSEPTALILVGKNRSISMHTLLGVRRLFGEHFRNFIFLAVGEVDAKSYEAEGELRTLRYTIENSLRYCRNFCHAHGLAAASYYSFGTDPVAELAKLTTKVMDEFPNSVCFAGKLIFQHDNVLVRMLHNQTGLALQRRLHLEGRQMVILPIKVD
jgi:amino acid transporter